ncbi:MAG: glycosyltransferase family 4 protein [Planctomycetaceae bacterium]
MRSSLLAGPGCTAGRACTTTLERRLLDAGHEVSLVPTYTPIRVDEPNQSERKVFFGGLNVYLRSRLPVWRRLPGLLTHWLDRPGLIRWATRFSISNDSAKLAGLTLDMLAGEAGPHQAAGAELARHITIELRPDAVIFSNALLAGALPVLRRQFQGPIFCTLQGDDVFLDGLPPQARQQAIARISQLAAEFDGFFVHSRFYRDYISDYLKLPVEKFHLLPLSIDLHGHVGTPGARAATESPTVGYFARIAPEKGLHRLVEAFEPLHARMPQARLRAAGYLGGNQRSYFAAIEHAAARFADAFDYAGSPETHADKVTFYRSLDVLSVPTKFLEPKGLYVLEALANGVPFVQPAHGAFPELLEATGGGLLVPPDDPVALGDAIESLLCDRERRIELGRAGQQAVRTGFTPQQLAERTIAVLAPLVSRPPVTS